MFLYIECASRLPAALNDGKVHGHWSQSDLWRVVKLIWKLFFRYRILHALRWICKFLCCFWLTFGWLLGAFWVPGGTSWSYLCTERLKRASRQNSSRFCKPKLSILGSQLAPTNVYFRVCSMILEHIFRGRFSTSFCVYFRYPIVWNMRFCHGGQHG